MSTAADKIPVVEEKPPRLKKDWRFYTGTAALGLSFVMPLCALFVPLLGLPTGLSAVIVGLLVAGGPEVMGLVAVALLGKETFQYFIYQVKSTFWDAVMVRPVSQTRYYFGLALHLGSWLPLYLYGYWPALACGYYKNLYSRRRRFQLPHEYVRHGRGVLGEGPAYLRLGRAVLTVSPLEEPAQAWSNITP